VPHWGYVVSGSLTMRYADREETFGAGDAYFAPPGHAPVVTEGTELVEFSPSEAFAQTMAVVARNLEAAAAS
jgi:mannose-6-phosphate isomerase-like protein (cupin superfamily)